MQFPESWLREFCNPPLTTQQLAETLTMAGVTADQIGTVILVGGSSLMGVVAQEAQALCPKAALQSADAFTAVVDGLALATGQKFAAQ